MKKLLKFVGGLVVVLVLLIVVVVVAAPLLFDPNDHKDTIVAKVKEATGRDLSIPGDIELSVFPWLGVKLGEVSLGNAAGFEAPVFARTEHVDVKVKLMPLLERRVEMSAVTLDGLTLNLERNADGSTNWQDLAQAGSDGDEDGDTGGEQQPSSSDDASTSAESPIAAIAIGGVALRNAHIAWSDRSNGQRLALTNVNLQTGAISPGEPTTLDGSLDINGQLAEGQDLTGNLTLKGTVVADPETQSAKIDGLDLKTNLSGGAVQGGTVELALSSAALTFDGSSQSGSAKNLALTVDLKEGAMAGGSAVLKLSMPAAEVDVATLALNAAQGLTIGTSLEGGPLGDGSADVRSVMGALAMRGGGSGTIGNVKVDVTVAGGPLQDGKAVASVSIPNLTLDPAAQSAGLDKLDLNADLEGSQFPGGRAKITLNAQALQLSGSPKSLSVASFALNALDLAVRGALEAAAADGGAKYDGNIEVESFNPRTLLAALGQSAPDTADPKALTSVSFKSKLGGTGGDIALSPFTLKFDQSTVQGTLTVANLSSPALGFDLSLDQIDADRYLPPEGSGGAKATTPGQAAASGAQEASTEGLRKLNAKGKIAIGQVKVAKMNFANVTGTLNAKDGLIRLSPIGARLYQGQYAGNIALDATGKTLVMNLDEKLSGVQVGDLLKDLTGDDKISGTANVTAKLSAQGSGADAVKQSLGGNVAFTFTNGALKGVNIGRLIREAKAKIEGKTLPPSNDVVKTDFSEMSGSMNFVDGLGTNQDFLAKSPLLRIEGKGTANLPTEALDYRVMTTIVGTSKGQGGKELQELKGVPIPLKVGGTFKQPTYGLDVEGLVQALAETKAKALLEGKTEELKKKAEEKLKKQVTEKVTKKLEEQVGSEATKKLEEIGGEKAKDLLKGLLGN
ncbi:MAG: AsmA family protein [Gammaproteobacteria bacterium]